MASSSVAATIGERPTTPTTSSSSPASCIAARKNGSVSIFPIRHRRHRHRATPSRPGSPPTHGDGRRRTASCRSRGAARARSSTARSTTRPRPTARRERPRRPRRGVEQASPSSAGMKPLVARASARSSASRVTMAVPRGSVDVPNPVRRVRSSAVRAPGERHLQPAGAPAREFSDFHCASGRRGDHFFPGGHVPSARGVPYR